MKRYLILALVISLLVGIILPLALGVKDLTLIAICFSSEWVIYAVLLLITTFLINPGLKIRVSRQKGVAVVRYELRDPKQNEKNVYANFSHQPTPQTKEDSFLKHTKSKFVKGLKISNRYLQLR
jgi:hypothetical protein